MELVAQEIRLLQAHRKAITVEQDLQTLPQHQAVEVAQVQVVKTALVQVSTVALEVLELHQVLLELAKFTAAAVAVERMVPELH